MDSNTNSPTPDPDEAKGGFRKPVNDGASRKYRRRSSASPSASPDESPKEDLRSNSTSLKEHKRKKHDSRDNRVSDRGDHSRGDKYVEEEDKNYSRLSSRSGRDSRGGAYNRSREDYHYKERGSRDKYDERDRHGRDREYRDEKRDYGRSSRDNRSEAENRSKYSNEETKKHDESDSKVSRERFQDDAPAKRNEEAVVKRTKFSSDRNDSATGSNQGQDLLGKDTPGQAVVNKPESAGTLDAAKVAAMKAAELVNKNLVGTGVMTAEQKKKLLWGNKKNTNTVESSHRWDAPIFSDRERQEKFNKLMGVKGEVKVAQNASSDVNQTEELELDLEKQYTAGLRRRDGRTVGLGL